MKFKDKRYQECSKIHKLWRKRWFLAIPFMYLYHLIKDLKIGIDKEVEDENGNKTFIHSDEYKVAKGKLLWRLIKGEVDSKMKHYYTMEEVEKIFKEKCNNK